MSETVEASRRKAPGLSAQAPVKALKPLSVLRSIDTGALVLSCPLLRDPAGLENVGGITDVTIGGAVRDMSALHLPAEMSQLELLDASEL